MKYYPFANKDANSSGFVALPPKLHSLLTNAQRMAVKPSTKDLPSPSAMNQYPSILIFLVAVGFLMDHNPSKFASL